MPTRCNRSFHCGSYCLLNVFRALLCSSSGAQVYYTVVAACGISCCGFQVAGLVWSWGLCVRFVGFCFTISWRGRQKLYKLRFPQNLDKPLSVTWSVTAWQPPPYVLPPSSILPPLSSHCAFIPKRTNLFRFSGVPRGCLGGSNPPPKFRRYRWSPRSHELEEPASRFSFVVHCVLIRL